MKKTVGILLLLLLSAVPSFAQTYKYISTENGLSNRRIFNINQDSVGYMWFLTNEGIDRYDGEKIKHYKLSDTSNPVPLTSYTGWLFMGEGGEPWVAGAKGRIFQYNREKDRFDMVYKSDHENHDLEYAYLDNDGNLWMCCSHIFSYYNIRNKKHGQLPNPLGNDITDMIQVDAGVYLIATGQDLCYMQQGENEFTVSSIEALNNMQISANELYYYPSSQKLFVGTIGRGVFVYDLKTSQVVHVEKKLHDVPITRIVPFNDDELLIATEGMGIHKMNRHTYESTPYIFINYEQHNEMGGNNINDIYVDKQQRIWLADFPIGVTIVNTRYQAYRWMKHAPGNSQSLTNNHVNSVIEDSDGDLWFGTGNGVSLYRTKTKQWHSFLNSSPSEPNDKSHIIVTLCEATPGIIWAGAYSAGVYRIDKKRLTAEYYSSRLMEINPTLRPDRYIRDIIKDSRGHVWLGGFNSLKECIPGTNIVKQYKGIKSVTAIAERDSSHMWVGSSMGLYLLDRHSGIYTSIKLLPEVNNINALYQGKDGQLYVATNGAGLLIYDAETDSLTNFHKDNSALITNHIYSILPEHDDTILLGTENGFTRFYIRKQLFHNWTQEQGLMSSCLNATDGVLRHDGSFIFGSTAGALHFPANVKLPEYVYSPMIFSEFQVFYRQVYPKEKNSPLEEHINRTKQLKLKYNQNSISFLISTINYDSPKNVFYKWKLDGFYDGWNRLEGNEHLRLMNLSPGDYTLHIEAYSKAEPYLLLEQRSMQITVSPPWWLSTWAWITYILLFGILIFGILRVMALRKQEREAEAKTRFFLSTAHNLRTPLTLVKAPLEDLLKADRHLEKDEVRSLNTALRNVENLQQLATNLINFEQYDTYSTTLHIARYELGNYVNDVCEAFRNYAHSRHIRFTYENRTSPSLSAWFDKEKMDSMLHNVLSNAVKYTQDAGQISVILTDTKDNWQILVKDSGIGISDEDQKKLFHLYFRGSNAVNSKVAGSGIGLPLVRKLVELHGGKIEIESAEQQGTTVYMTFPKNKRYFHHYEVITPITQEMKITPGLPLISSHPDIVTAGETHFYRLLVVEDNDELRTFLLHTLSKEYHVRVCSDGEEALRAVSDFYPDLVLADIMMPRMRGDDLCIALKGDIATSHIPVILLTALSSEQYILKGLNIKADAYITKPFNMQLLKATIANKLANRELQKQKYANLELPTLPAETDSASRANSLDVRFLTTLKQYVEEHLTTPDFTVDSLCTCVGMSRTSFYNKLKVLTGQTPSDFVRTIRLQYAKELLNEEKYSITEVAELSGFCDSKYFREVFKKYFGTSPSNYTKKTTNE